MSGDLSAAGDERLIFIRALQEYREVCELPVLNTSCPFRKIDSAGRPFCVEECVEILRKHSAPPLVEEVGLGEFRFHRVRRPRPRHIRGEGKPFDAAEHFLSDKHRRLSDWRTSSLLMGLKEHATSNPNTRIDAELLDKICDELQRRNIDAESVLRYGFGQDIAISVAVTGALSSSSGSPATVEAARPVKEAWGPVFAAEFDGATDEQEMESSAVRALYRLEKWVRTAPIADVLAWTAPQGGRFDDSLVEPPAGATGDRARWLADRFTRTYLNQWSQEALQLEWQYMHGRTAPVSTQADMAVREIDVKELAIALADKSTRSVPDNSPPLVQFVSVAIKMLGVGDIQQAVGIFRAVVRLQPRSGEAHNNLGFCLLPLNEKEALSEFELAAELGYRTPWSVGNRVLAYVLVGRLSTAITIAKSYLAITSSSAVGVNGYQWSIGRAGRLELTRFEDIRRHIADLALTAARRAGDEPEIAYWVNYREQFID